MQSGETRCLRSARTPSPPLSSSAARMPTLLLPAYPGCRSSSRIRTAGNDDTNGVDRTVGRLAVQQEHPEVRIRAVASDCRHSSVSSRRFELRTTQRDEGFGCRGHATPAPSRLRASRPPCRRQVSRNFDGLERPAAPRAVPLTQVAIRARPSSRPYTGRAPNTRCILSCDE